MLLAVGLALAVNQLRLGLAILPLSAMGVGCSTLAVMPIEAGVPSASAIAIGGNPTRAMGPATNPYFNNVIQGVSRMFV